MTWRKKLSILLILCAIFFFLGAVTVVNLATQVTGLLGKTNGGTGISSTATFPSSGTVSITVASGTSALGTSAISSGACATIAPTATGATTSDAAYWTLSATPTSTNMYSWLHIHAVPASNTLNIFVCNASASSRTPTAMSINWRVVR